MKPLESPDLHHLRAAEGWLDLGNPRDAIAELDRIAPEHQLHPDALEMRWQIHAAIGNWDTALEVARSIVERAPSRPAGWLHRAYSVRRATGGTVQAAYDALRPAAEEFPEVPTFPFNLACYACQMGHLAEARDWLRRAFAIAEGPGKLESLRQMALEDPDLEPLRTEIDSIEP